VLSRVEGMLDRRYKIGHAARGGGPLHMRPHQRQLIDILERAAALQHGWRGAAQQYDRRLRDLRVFNGGDCVGQARPGGDGGHTRAAGQACDRVGREHGGGLVARVDHADAALLAAGQDRRDMPAAERKQEAGALRRQDTCDQITAVHSHLRCFSAHCQATVYTRARVLSCAAKRG
jgi:hypothetical protein